MKKIIIVWLIVFVIFLLGCTNYSEISETENKNCYLVEDSMQSRSDILEERSIEAVDELYRWQIQSLYDNYYLWQSTDDDNVDSDWYCLYAITDLDRDGYLEILKRYHFSNGPVNKIWIYEVTDDNSIIEINSNLESQNSEFRSSDYPDLSEQPMGVYRGLDGVYRYLVCDTVSSGVNGGQINYGIMSMEDNTFIFDVVLRECYQANGSSGEYDYTYFDEDDNEIEEDDYCQRYSEYESLPEDVVHINWFAYITMDNLIESFEVWNSNDISSAMPVTIPTTTPTAIPESLSLQEQDLSSYVSDIGGSSVYHVPQLLIEGEYASQVNAEISWIYGSYAQEQDRHYTGSEYIAFLSDGGCLSLVFVEQGIWDDDVYHVYNIDVNTGSRVTNEQIEEMAGVTDIGQAAEDAVLQYIDMYLPSPMLDEQMEYTLSEENLNADMMIGLTSESEMFFVSEVGSLGGASYYYEIYDEDGNDLLHLDFWVAW